jgi:exosortase A-associated hydrolase 1
VAPEEAVAFPCGEEHLIGVLSRPAEQVQSIGVVIVVGGPQVRAGSHRQFVVLARALAAAGYTTLRFDVRGMGDSTGAARSFEALSDDIVAAIDALQARAPTLRGVVLWGLCDAASAALLYQQERADPRIAGLCLVNPWTRSAVTLARTHVKHYYLQRLAQRTFWSKLLRGRVGLGALASLWRNVRTAHRKSALPAAASRPFQQRMAMGWASFRGPMLLLLSGNDYTAKEFLEHAAADWQWKQCLAQRNVQRIDIPGADHTFSGTLAMQRLLDDTLEWLRRAFAPAA